MACAGPGMVTGRVRASPHDDNRSPQHVQSANYNNCRKEIPFLEFANPAVVGSEASELGGFGKYKDWKAGGDAYGCLPRHGNVSGEATWFTVNGVRTSVEEAWEFPEKQISLHYLLLPAGESLRSIQLSLDRWRFPRSCSEDDSTLGASGRGPVGRQGFGVLLPLIRATAR